MHDNKDYWTLTFHEQVEASVKILERLNKKPERLSIWDKVGLTIWIWIAW